MSSNGTGGVGIERVGARQVLLRVGEGAVRLVAAERVEQVAGQQRPHRALGASVRTAESQHLRQPPALDQPVRAGLADDAERGGLPRLGQRERVGVQGGRVGRAGQQQTRHLQRRSGLLGRGAGDAGEQGRDRCGFGGHPGGGEHRGGAPEAVAHHPELGRVDADLAGPEAHARDDVEGGAEVEREVEHRGRQAALGVGGAGHDAPGRQVFEEARVARGAGKPVVAEGHAGQVETRFGGVHHARQSGEGQVAPQYPVRTTALQGGDELADAGHASTLAHRNGRLCRQNRPQTSTSMTPNRHNIAYI